MKIRSSFNDKQYGITTGVLLESGDKLLIQTDSDEQNKPRVVIIESHPGYDSTMWSFKAVATSAEIENDRKLSDESSHKTKGKS